MKNFGYLTNEEYHAIRDCLGLTQNEAADLHGLSRKETVQAWEWGKSTISTAACDKITATINKINDILEQIITDWEETQDDVFLITYDDEDYQRYIFGLGRELPNSVHKKLMYRAYVELKRLGAIAYIVKFNRASYAYFLAEKGRTDDIEQRYNWARWYRTNYFNVLPIEKEERRIATHTAEEMYFWLTDHPNIKGFDRYMDIVKFRMDGNNLTQVAQLLGVSRQRINKLWHDLDDMID